MWTAAQVEQTKARIKEELDRVESADGRQARLRFILQCLHNSAAEDDDLSRLRIFVLIVSALVFHQRYGGLISGQHHSLYNKAVAILQAQAIEPGRSRLAFLWGELHQVRSLIERRDGNHWQAAWAQQLSGYLSRPTGFHNTDHQAIAVANRALRLGNTRLAMKWFQQAAAQSQGGVREQAVIGQIQTSRLMGNPELTVALIDRYRGASQKFSSAAAHEFMWEILRLDHLLTGRFADVVSATSKSAPLFAATYIIEAYLLAASLSSKEWLPRMRKMRTVARDRQVDTSRRPAEFAFALTLETCYESGIPLVIRLKDMGAQLASLNRFVSIDKEITAWAAAARWLVRAHAKPLAVLALSEYRSLSLRLSDGKHDDVTRTCRDLLDSTWFQEGMAASEDFSEPTVNRPQKTQREG